MSHYRDKTMYRDLFIQAGLRPEAAEIYEILLQNGPLTAGALLKKASLKRGHLYKVLHDMTGDGTITQAEKRGKMLFVPESPEKLLERLEGEAEKAAQRAKEVREQLPQLKATFLTSTERPTVRFYDGHEALQDLYNGCIDAHDKRMVFVRPGPVKVYEKFGNWFGDYMKRRIKAGIRVDAITPDDPETVHDSEVDKSRNFHRTWVNMGDYSAPVEFLAYGDTLGIISYGKEIFGLSLENPVIAEGFKQLFALARKGAETIEVKHDHA